MPRRGRGAAADGSTGRTALDPRDTARRMPAEGAPPKFASPGIGGTPITMSLEGIIVGLLAIAIGGLWATYGLKAFTILLPFWAFFVGLIAGASFLQGLFGNDFAFLATTTSWIGGFIVGIVFAVLSYFIFYFAVVLFGATIGYGLGAGLLVAIGLDGFLSVVAGLIVGAIVALAVLVLAVPAIVVVVLTAFSGAAGVVNGVLILLGQINLEDVDAGLMEGLLKFGPIALAAWVVVAAAGIWYQWRDIRTGMEKAAFDRSNYMVS